MGATITNRENKGLNCNIRFIFKIVVRNIFRCRCIQNKQNRVLRFQRTYKQGMISFLTHHYVCSQRLHVSMVQLLLKLQFFVNLQLRALLLIPVILCTVKTPYMSHLDVNMNKRIYIYILYVSMNKQIYDTVFLLHLIFKLQIIPFLSPLFSYSTN